MSRRTPLAIGLTGGIASGKSAALAAFGKAGAATTSADAIVHELLGTEQVLAELRDRWGDRVTDGDGAVDRSAIAEIVFADPGELAWLESVLHPRVRERVADWQRGLPDATTVAVVEIPLLFESELEGGFDAVVAIRSPDELRRERAGARDHAALEGREARQLSQDEKARRAHHVIDNDADLTALDRQVSELLSRILANSEMRPTAR